MNAQATIKSKAQPHSKTKKSTNNKPVLNEREQSAMDFARFAFKEPWFRLTHTLAELEKGEDLDHHDRQVDPVLLPISLDAKLASMAMKLGGLRLFIGQNASMLTLVTNEAGDRLIWACLEGERDGVYIETVLLSGRLDETWALDLAHLCQEEDLEGAYNYARSFIGSDAETSHIALGLVKVANIKFFEAFQEAWETADNGRNQPVLMLGMQNAVNEIVQNNWVRLYPEAGLSVTLNVLKPLLALSAPLNKLLIKTLA